MGCYMKLRYIVLFVLAATKIYAADDQMIDTIKKIDPDNLSQLLIPGFFFRAEQKERYLSVAQEMTNRTYKELHSYSLGDFVRFFKGTTKLGLSGLSVYAGYRYHKKHWDISRWSVESYKASRQIIGQDLTDKYHRAGVYAGLGILAWYMLGDGFSDLSNVFNKRYRLERHRKALVNEAIIQRLPVCDATSCDSLLG